MKFLVRVEAKRLALEGHTAPSGDCVRKNKRSGAWYRRLKHGRFALAVAVGLDPNHLSPAKPGPKPDPKRIAALRRYLIWLGDPDQKNLRLPQERKYRVRALLGNPPRHWRRRKKSIRALKRLETSETVSDPIGDAIWQEVRARYRRLSKKTFRRDVLRIHAELWGTRRETNERTCL